MLNDNDPKLSLSKFSGINNLQDPMALNIDELVDALNVDITRSGLIKTRNPTKLFLECQDGKSLFSDNYNFYFIDDDTLYTCNETGIKTALDTGYRGLNTVFLKDLATKNLLISNEKFIKRYKNKIYNITPETFDNTLLNLSYGNNGGFPVGRYLISLTFLHDDGIEGGTGPSKVANVTVANSNITIRNIQTTTDINISQVRVYISDLNSNTLKHYGDYDIDIDTITLNYTTQLGKFLTVFNKNPMWCGDVIEKYRGVIYTAKDNILYLSDPLSYTTNNNYIEFESNITMAISVVDGIYVSDENNLYFLSGENPLDLTRTLIYNASAVKGTQERNIMTNDVFFFTNKGQIVASNSGKFENLTESKFLPDRDFTSGASLVMYHDGIRKIINTFKTGEQNQACFGDWIKAEIIRN